MLELFSFSCLNYLSEGYVSNFVSFYLHMNFPIFRCNQIFLCEECDVWVGSDLPESPTTELSPSWGWYECAGDLISSMQL